MKWVNLAAIIFAVLFFGLSNTTAAESPPAAKAKGSEETLKTRVLEAGAGMLQGKEPLDAVSVYLDGFHFHNGNMKEQAEAHHYCTQLNEDFIQCVIYSGNGKDALLMGVEYVITEKLFNTLPQDERKMWHSHAYEVKSGQLVAPGLPDQAEHELMEKLVSTYGKTWHTWHISGTGEKELPLGIPALMMGFTADGQIDPALVGKRDKQFDISTEAKKKNRSDIAVPSVAPGADAWQKGNVAQLELVPR